MTSRDFCYWLQGHFELNGTDAGMTPKQAALVQKHLSLVFIHEIDPSAGDEDMQAKLNEVHGNEAAALDNGAPAGDKPIGKVSSGDDGRPPVYRC